MSVKPLWYVHEEPRRQYPELVPPSAEVVEYGKSPIEPDLERRARGHRASDAGAAGSTGPASVATAIARAEAALQDAVGRMELADPVLPAVLPFLAPALQPVKAAEILGRWRLRQIDGEDLDDEPWPLGRDAAPNSDVYDTDDRRGAHWRPAEVDFLDRDPTEYTRRLMVPITVAVNTQFLAASADATNVALSVTARDLLSEVRPGVEASLADSIRADDPWRDTFLLWLLVRRPLALEELHPLVFAAAARYGTLASRMAGIVYGTAAPFDRQPLVSATAHLGLALWKLDYRPTLLPGIVAFVRANRRDDGGFGDPGQPSDVLTTLAAAELLSTLDPHWDPRPTAEWFAANQEPAGWWRALDPEVPWLTAEVLDWLRRSTATFEARFGWPEYQKLDRDRKTGIPGYAAFDRLIRALSELDGFRSGLVELAFIDLAHFKKFNEDLGQDRGDDVLRFFAQSIAAIPASLAIRDGGDEFILVGAPTATTLNDGIAAFRAEWPRRFAAEFGQEAPAVAPRIIVAPATGGTIRGVREELGRLITRVKGAFKEPGPEGVMLDVDEARAIARTVPAA